MAEECVYIGAKNTVAAVDQRTGQIVWRTKLSGGWFSDGYVNVLLSRGQVIAHAGGRLYCLDRQTGAMVWVNELEGMGNGFCCMAADGQTACNNSGGVVSEKAKQQAAAATLPT